MVIKNTDKSYPYERSQRSNKVQKSQNLYIKVTIYDLWGLTSYHEKFAKFASWLCWYS